jgi:acetyl/propionyl-CoA carboxylase alpha subunit
MNRAVSEAKAAFGDAVFIEKYKFSRHIEVGAGDKHGMWFICLRGMLQEGNRKNRRIALSLLTPELRKMREAAVW